MTVNHATGPPDGGYGWVVLFCCAFSLCTVIGLGRISGMVVKELIDVYDINRTEAFLVIVLHKLFGFAFAPVVGKLLTKFDYSVILCIGNLLLRFSLILTSLTTSYWQVLITYGCLQGLGVNCITSTSFLTVGIYFNKRRSLAMGIMCAIGGASGFIYPLLFNWLLEMYYLNGALLILGALALHSCALGMLVRQPIWLHQKEPMSKEEEDLLKFSTSKSKKYSECPSKLLSNGIGKTNKPIIEHKFANFYDEEDMKELRTPLNFEVQPKPKGSRLSAILKEIRQDLKLCKDGHFLLQLVNRSLVMITFAYFLPILPDFVEGEMFPVVTKKEVAFVLSMASTGDVICRLLIGSILDKLPWAKKHSLGGLSICMGVTALAFQFATVYTHLVIGSVIFGLWMGMVIVVMFLVEMELMGPARVHMANGLLRFFIGGTNVAAGVLVGYMRDQLGSYKACLSFLGGCGVLGGLVWVAEPLVIKCFPPQLLQEKEQKKNNKAMEES